MNNKINKKIPKFKNEDEERRFWSKNDTTDYFNWENPIRNPSFSNLRPSIKTISIRLPQHLLDALRTLAHKKDVPYQALMKQYLSEKIREEYVH